MTSAGVGGPVARKLLCVILALGVVGASTPVAAQGPPHDEELSKGIRQVDEGDYDAAILTLDAAARRLAADKAPPKELAQAYLYLGVAYLGRSHEIAARARFVDAVLQDRELTLTPDRFAPKVIELFESARKDAIAAQPSAPAASPTPVQASPAAPPAKKGGSKTPLILLGVGGAAAAGVAIAAGSGRGGGPATPDITRFYGNYSNVAYVGQASGCSSFSANFAVSGNADGSGFQILKTVGSSTFTFTGTIQSSGAFTGTSPAGFSIGGQTTGSRITGTENRTAAPTCMWSFDGSR